MLFLTTLLLTGPVLAQGDADLVTSPLSHAKPEAVAGEPGSFLAAKPATPLALVAQTAPDEAPGFNDFNYNFVDAGIVLGDYTGVEVGFSHQVHGAFIGVGQVAFLTDDPVDILSFSAGGGYVHSLETDLDFVATIQLEFVDVEVRNFSDDDTGLRGGAAVRYRVDEKLEVGGGMGFRTAFDNSIQFGGGALYELNENMDAFARAVLNNSDDIEDDFLFSTGVRFAIGRE